MDALIKIIKEGNRNYFFEIKNEVDQFLFTSVKFYDKKEVQNRIVYLQSTDSKTIIFERKTNYDGKFQFRLKTKDGFILGNSGPFQSQAGMENGIRQMKNHLANLSSL